MSLSCALLLPFKVDLSFVLGDKPLGGFCLLLGCLLFLLLLLILLILWLLFPLLLSFLPLLVLLGQRALCLLFCAFGLLLLLLLHHLRSQLGCFALFCSVSSGVVVIVVLFKCGGNLARQGGWGTNLCHLFWSRLSILLGEAAYCSDEIVHICVTLTVCLWQKELIIVYFIGKDGTCCRSSDRCR